MKPTKDSKVIQVEPWGEGQGDYVNIYEDDFDPKKHKKYVTEAEAKAAKAKAAKAKADAKKKAEAKAKAPAKK